MTSKRDYYDVLGLDKSATAAQIKSAYRKQALKWHPDRNKNGDAETKFKEINEAYEILSNPKKKQTYDQFGHAAFDPSVGGPFSRAGSAKTGPFTYTYHSQGSPGSFNEAFGGFSDPFQIFETFFGGGGFNQSYRPKTRYSLKIDFMDAVKGAEKKIVHQGKQYTVRIPAGADDGTRIRYSNFDVSLNVSPHSKFKREGYDVYLDQHLSFVDAILGTTINVPTLNGDLKVKVKAGTQPNTLIRLSGKGINHLQSSRRGDFYIRLLVDLPKRTNRKQKQILKQF